MIDNQILAPELLKEVSSQIKILCRENWSSDTIKLVCTFLISTLPKDEHSERATDRTIHLTFANHSVNKELYSITARNLLLQCLIEIVDQNENYTRNAEDLLYAVTSRWILLFIGEKMDSETVVLACRLLYTTWRATDQSQNKFKETFILLKPLIASRIDDTNVYLPLWGILCNAVIQQENWSTFYDEAHLMALMAPKESNTGDKSQYCPGILPSLLALTATNVSELQKLLVVPQESLETESIAKISKYSSSIRTTLSFLSHMYHQFQQMRDTLLTQHTIDHIVEIFRNLICHDAAGYSLKLDYVPDAQLDKTVNRFKLQEDVNKLSKFALMPRNQLHTMNPKTKEIINSLLEFLMVVLVDSILDPFKPLFAVDLLLKSIPNPNSNFGQQFQEFILLCTMDSLSRRVQKRKQYLADYKVCVNLSKFSNFLVDCYNQGLFVNRKDTLFDFIVLTLELTLPNDPQELSQKKSTLDFHSLFRPLNRLSILLLNTFSTDHEKLAQLIMRIIQYQQECLHPQNSDQDYIKCIVYHFYNCLSSEDQSIKDMSRIVWKHLLLLKPVQIFAILRSSKVVDYKDLVDGFSKLLNSNEQFDEWFALKKIELDSVFKETVASSLSEFSVNEQRAIKETQTNFEKLLLTKTRKQKKRNDLEMQLYNKYVEKSSSWIMETHLSESSKRKKYKADYKIMQSALEIEWKELNSQLNREKAILGVESEGITRWKLDFTEAKARVRKKMRPNYDHFIHYQSKAEKVTFSHKVESPNEQPRNSTSSSDVEDSPQLQQQKSESPLGFAQLMNDPELEFDDVDESHPDEPKPPSDPHQAAVKLPVPLNLPQEGSHGDVFKETELEWEELALEENENQKIQRVLVKGDQVIDIVNCARLIGLELIECICIISQQNIYILDNYFRKADGANC
jgi:hypothetical protein